MFVRVSAAGRRRTTRPARKRHSPANKAPLCNNLQSHLIFLYNGAIKEIHKGCCFCSLKGQPGLKGQKGEKGDVVRDHQ